MLTRTGQWTVVFVHLPQCDPLPAGVLLWDSTTDSLHVKLRSQLPTDDEAVTLVWNELADDLVQLSAEAGCAATLSWLEDVASNTIRIGEREVIQFHDSTATMELLFQKHVLQSRGQAAGYGGSP